MNGQKNSPQGGVTQSETVEAPCPIAPCPFCGGEQTEFDQSAFNSIWVICKGCEAEGPYASVPPTSSMEAQYRLAIQVWNRWTTRIDEAVKAEREACAQFIDKQAEGFQALIDHAPTEIRREELKRLKHSLNESGRLIRAREKK